MQVLPTRYARGRAGLDLGISLAVQQDGGCPLEQLRQKGQAHRRGGAIKHDLCHSLQQGQLLPLQGFPGCLHTSPDCSHCTSAACMLHACGGPDTF